MNTQVDANKLANELSKNIQGEVRFDPGSRALYATDGSNYRQTPIGIVIPKTIDEVITTVEICRKNKAPILSRGGGTSLAGQCCNVAVIIDFSKYINKVLEINTVKKLARVQPGCVLDKLRKEAENYHLTFGPDPSTHNHNTLGGMIGNNSCGTHSVLAQFEGEGGRTSDNVESLEILTYDGIRLKVGKTDEKELTELMQQPGRIGEIYRNLKNIRDNYADLIRKRYPNIPRRVSGYNLDELLPEKNFNVARALVGTESTCIIILEATLQLIYHPPVRSLLALGYPDVCIACKDVPQILKHKPSALEGLDDILIGFMKKKHLHEEDAKLLPDGNGWLVVEFGGKTKEESDGKAKKLMAELKVNHHPPSMKLYDNEAEEKKIWLVRESGLGATADVPDEPSNWPGWEDSAVSPEVLSGYIKELKELFKKYQYHVSVYGHFGQGCVHCRIPFDLITHDGIKKFRSFLDEAADLVVKYGGSLSGEHGDGQSRAELLEKMFGKELLEAFKQFKLTWDPEWKMNPGKVVEPYKITENLRLGVTYNPWNPKTHFKFPQDEGNVTHAFLRCVGIGNCRKVGEGIMCPSYMVTLEEKNSTRGRARLLFEMLRGEVIGKKGWKDDSVRESLDLCLACKGCKGECPVNVDMASYKAEFLSHYYAKRLRPRSAYAFGFIYLWAKFAAKMPRLTNFLTHAPMLRSIAKFITGMDSQRDIPHFAPQTFVNWFEKRKPVNVGCSQVLLWPDTFTNYFHPEIAMAAVEVLEAGGYQVLLPKKKICCGRPLYDYGFLKTAKNHLLKILECLRTEIRDGIPIVGLEPSCVAVFRDELMNLLPHDQDAKRLNKQTYMISQFVSENINKFNFTKLNNKAIVQAHCHQKAVVGMGGDQELLKKLGLDYEILDAGCCGMAGSFGYEKGERFKVSIKAGERALFPAVRNTKQDSLIIANGFSCRNQIFEGTKRRSLHIAEVLKLALEPTRIT